ncbi:MAG: hypothetical protein GX891_00020 [Clostridiales bacterium]|nr:hypothetical protein [Clostridiales bacterium]
MFFNFGNRGNCCGSYNYGYSNNSCCFCSWFKNRCSYDPCDRYSYDGCCSNYGSSYSGCGHGCNYGWNHGCGSYYGTSNYGCGSSSYGGGGPLL